MTGAAGGVPEVISVLAPLIIILGSLLVLAAAMRRWRHGTLRGLARTRSRQGRLSIIAAQQVGWQLSLHIVEAEGQRFLIGASRSGITCLGQLSSDASQGDSRQRAPAGGVLSLRPSS